MKQKNVFLTPVRLIVLLFLVIALIAPLSLTAQTGTQPPEQAQQEEQLQEQARQEDRLPEQASKVDYEAIEKKVQELMEDGDIPGLSLVMIKGDRPVYMKGFGYTGLEKKTPVTSATLFELASCSKAFTALAMLKLEKEGLINLDAPVSRYLSWFYTMYQGKKQEITLRQLLHQSSGIPPGSIAKIPESAAADALQQTARNLAGIELDFLPGLRFQYATINYDVLGAVIEAVSDTAYEEYMVKNIFHPLGLNDTLVGKEQLQAAGKEAARGHKISFFKARPYTPPDFRGNNPAAYIMSNGSDIARWLRLQMGMEQNDLTPLLEKSRQRDRTVPPDMNTMVSYAMGWMASIDGSGVILHSGLNPNFTTFFIFDPEDRTGVAVMANSNSSYTSYIGRAVMHLLYGDPLPPETGLDGNIDKSASVMSIILCVYLLFVLVFLALLLLQLVKGKRGFKPVTLKILLRWIVAPILLVPFAAGIYLLPYVIGGVPWATALVWSPISFKTAAFLIIVAMVCSYISYMVSSLFPHKNEYLHSVPFLILISLLSGGANAVVIFLLSMSLYVPIDRGYVLFYFCLASGLYLLGRRALQGRLVTITFGIIYDLRMRLISRIFTTSYQKYEKLDSGRVIATLNNDTTQLGGTANFLVAVLSSLITVTGAFLYLATIAFWTTLVTLAVIVIVAVVYVFVTRRAARLFNVARDTQNDYLGLLNGMNDGFKELSLHSSKKVAYRDEIEGVTQIFRSNASRAMLKFINAFMIGESMLVMVLGAVAFGIPAVLPHIKTTTLMSFIMVLLYLIGPFTAILNSIPGLTQMNISWQRVRGLMRDIPGNLSSIDTPRLPSEVGEVQEIDAKGVFFEYETKDESEKFAVGPLDFRTKKGEIVFIIGGNGSGKTTLAKMLTGLYIPDDGNITINGKDVPNDRLGEYFSVVFGGFHLFEKLYDVDLSGKEKEVQEYLEMLRLQDKVKIENNAFSTLELSGGQRKRLALLRCYLEDRPIYLFDEVAADQDPGFRKFFYRTLLPKMKERGKIVIAITHDDHYFDVADRVIKLDMGKIEQVENSADLKLTS